MKTDEQLILLDLGDELTGSAYCSNVEGEVRHPLLIHGTKFSQILETFCKIKM